jgi:hypothetical protein
MIGLIIGIVLFLFGLIYFAIFNKFDEYFNEFKNKFVVDNFGKKYYNIPMIERILSPALLIFLISMPILNAILIGIYLILIIIVAVKKPYAGDGKCKRPIANSLIMIAIQGIILAVNMSKDPTNMLAVYGPFAILGLLTVCLAYSIYALVQDIKQSMGELKNLLNP